MEEGTHVAVKKQRGELATSLYHSLAELLVCLLPPSPSLTFSLTHSLTHSITNSLTLFTV